MGWGICGRQRLARGRSHAIRPWSDQEAYEGKDGAANETGDIFLANCGTAVSHEIFQESSSSRDGDIITSRLFPRMPLGWLAPPALRLALRYICVQSFSVSRVLAAHVTAPLS